MWMFKNGGIGERPYGDISDGRAIACNIIQGLQQSDCFVLPQEAWLATMYTDPNSGVSSEAAAMFHIGGGGKAASFSLTHTPDVQIHAHDVKQITNCHEHPKWLERQVFGFRRTEMAVSAYLAVQDNEAETTDLHFATWAVNANTTRGERLEGELLRQVINTLLHVVVSSYGVKIWPESWKKYNEQAVRAASHQKGSQLLNPDSFPVSKMIAAAFPN
jgi:hypothetical protein